MSRKTEYRLTIERMEAERQIKSNNSRIVILKRSINKTGEYTGKLNRLIRKLQEEIDLQILGKDKIKYKNNPLKPSDIIPKSYENEL